MSSIDPDDRERRWRRLALEADSILSLIRHRGGVRFGGPLPESYEVDAMIGALRQASKGILAEPDGHPA